MASTRITDRINAQIATFYSDAGNKNKRLSIQLTLDECKRLLAETNDKNDSFSVRQLVMGTSARILLFGVNILAKPATEVTQDLV